MHTHTHTHTLRTPELSRVVVQERKFPQLLFKHLLHLIRQLQVFHTITKLVRDGLLVVFLRKDTNSEADGKRHTTMPYKAHLQAKLSLDDLELLLKKESSLYRVDLLLHLKQSATAG